MRCLLPLLLATGLMAADASPISGTWIIWESAGSCLLRTKVTWKGMKSASGVGLQWANLPDTLADQIAHGKAPKTATYDRARVAGQVLEVKALEGGKVLVSGRGVQGIQGEKTAPVAWELKLITDGLLVGSGAKGLDSNANVASQVLACREDAFVPQGAPPGPGTTTEIACLDGAVPYHYQLRLPKGYDAAKPAPLLVVFNPGGNAKPMQPKLLDELGWVCAALTESKNGPWDPITQNRDAALFDLHRRVAIDWTKVRFAGVSGGARASILSACHHADSVAGVFAIVAGTCPPWHPARDVPIFYITGKTDMNRQEIQDAHAADVKDGRPTDLILHDGGHNVGGGDNEIRGLRWLAERAPAAAVPAAKTKTTKKP